MSPKGLPPQVLPGESYYENPNSVSSLSAAGVNGPLIIACFGTLSAISTLTLLVFLSYRLFYWTRYFETGVTYSQNVVLIYNLLLADFFQGLSFALGFHWVRLDGIFAPTSICDFQATMITFGDMSSGIFILFIGIHTMFAVIYGKTIPYRLFIGLIVGCWVFSVFLAGIGPVIRPGNLYSAAGQWCWINSVWEAERLYLHYLWIFIFEFGSIVIYAIIFFRLRKQLTSIRKQLGSVGTDSAADNRRSLGAPKSPMQHRNLSTTPDNPLHSRVNRATFFMIVYPLVYCFCTLPLAAGRMYTMSTGNSSPSGFWILAGSLIASCGWIDACLYTVTRRVLFHSGKRPSRRAISTNRSGTDTDIEMNSATSGSEGNPFEESFASVKTSPAVVTIPFTCRVKGGESARRDSDCLPSQDTKTSYRNGDTTHTGRCDSSVSAERPLAGVIQAETKVEVTVTDAWTTAPPSPPRKGYF